MVGVAATAEVYMNDETLRNDLNEAKKQAKAAARATLIALRDAMDFAIGKLEDRDRADASQAGETQREGDVPPARPGDEPVRDNAFDA
jgi:hypothetical protein